jgi:pimeloyl-ACP methyl ester carboxylesterase
VDVVASSWGGAVALFLAARSRKVRSLVLAAPVNPWSDFGAERIRFLSSRLGGCLLRMAIPLSSPLHRVALRRMYGDPGRIPDGTLQGYAPMLMRRGRVHNLLNVLRSWESDMRALRGERFRCGAADPTRFEDALHDLEDVGAEEDRLALRRELLQELLHDRRRVRIADLLAVNDEVREAFRFAHRAMAEAAMQLERGKRSKC